MKKVITVISSVAILASVFMCYPSLFASHPIAQDWLNEMEQKLKQHIGEKVILLRLDNSLRGKGSDDTWHAHMYETPTKPITNQEWAARFFGKAGVLTSVERYNYWAREIPSSQKQGIKWIVTLDGGERIGLLDFMVPAIFQSQLEIARQNIGRTFWARGKKYVYAQDSPLWPLPAEAKEASSAIDKSLEITVPNTHQVTITSIELGGDRARNIFPCFALADGRKVCATGIDATKFEESEWLIENPRKKYPTWHKGIWELIEKQQLAIGMTMDMVKLTCSRGIYEKGIVLSLTSPSESGTIATCYGLGVPYVLIQGNKIVKFVE